MSDKSVWAQAPERFALAAVYQDVAAVIGWDAAIDFGMKVWQTKRPPSRSKFDPVHGGGCGCIYIPKELVPSAGSELIRLAGHEVAEKLVHAFPGIGLEFPCIVAASIARRNRVIAQQVADGVSVASVALGFDLTERHVRRIVKQESRHVR